MKILHIRSSEFFGGPERAIIGQCRHIENFYMACASFVRNRKPNNFLQECDRAGIETFRIRELFTGDFGCIKRIRKLLVEKDIDIVVSHDYKANFFTRYAVNGIRAGQIAHFRGRTTEDTKVRLYNFIDWRTMRRLHRVFTVSEASRKLLISRGIKAGNIRVVFNAIDVNDADSPPVKSFEKNKTIKVVAAGRLSREKGYDLLLEAIAKIKSRVPPFTVDIYGDGPELKNLVNQRERLSINDFVNFRGFIKNVKPVLAGADFLVLPSRSEGMPNILLEAWSQGLGVLSTAVGAVPDMIVDGESGLLAEQENVGHLSDKLIEAFGDAAKMHEFGRKGFDIVRNKYSYERQAKVLTELYHEFFDEYVKR